jgi:two-component system KDP operon response regulator KdpE
MEMSASRPRTRILALTGEMELLRLLRSILEPSGCKVSRGALALEGAAVSGLPDIVILDLETVDLDLVSRVRLAYPDAEIIAICSAYREADCIAILERNVDYLPRPFRAQDLAVRVRVAELRRFKAAGRSRFYRRGSFVVDLFERTVALDGEPIALAPSELSVLMLLAAQPGLVMTFGDILVGMGRGDSASGRRALYMSVLCLRRRIERDPSRPDLLLTEARVGYRLAPESGNQSNLDASMPERKGDGGRSV